LGEEENMATLSSIITQLSKKFDMPYRKINDHEFVLEVKFDDDRSQAVEVAIREDEDGQEWMFMHSVIGPIDELDAHELLKRNDAPGYAYVAADKDEAFVQAQIPLDSCDVELCKEMIFKTASFADALEDEFIGGDKE
jgi:hypothetical protein